MPGAGAHSFVRAPREAFWSLNGVSGGLRNGKKPISRGGKNETGPIKPERRERAAPGSSLLWGLAWAATLVVAMVAVAPACIRSGQTLPQSSKCCCSRGQ